MTADLDTLLRDAGREPTIDLDVDGVHNRGRRRTVVRRAAASVGVLALLGVVAVGVSSLPAADQPGIGPIDQAPTASDEDGAPRTAQQLPRVSETGLAAELGVTVLRIDPLAGPVTDITAPLTMTATTPDGEVATDAWAPGDLGPGPFGVATADGTVWGVDPDGNVVGRSPLTASVGRIVGSDHPWVPMGTTRGGDLLVTTSGRAIEDGVAPQAGVRRVGTEVVEPFPAVDLAAVLGDSGFLTAAAAATEALVVASVHSTDDPTVAPTRVHLLPSGGEPVLLYESDINGRLVLDVEVVGDEVWVLEMDDADTIVRRLSLDGGDLGRVEPGSATAFGDVSAITVAPDGATVVLSMRPGELPGGAVVVDVAAIREGASLYDVGRVLGAAGTVHLLPAPETAMAPARCATEPYAQELDIQAVDAVWLPCSGTGGDDRVVSFFPVERLSGVDFASEEARLEAYLDALFDGPTDAEQTLGLEPVVSPDVVSVAGVVVDGTTVTVDLAPGERAGVLGTTYAGAVFETAVAAAVLQFTGYDQVTLTLDGSCDAWAGLREADGCSVLGQRQTPWWEPTGE